MSDRMVYLKRAIELTPEEIARCKELSYGDEGYMSEDLDRIMIDEARWRYRYSHVNLIKDNDYIIAWALMQPMYRSPRWTFQCFVDSNYRRQGIGKYLLYGAHYFAKRKPIVYLDDDNEEFFTKYKTLVTEV